MRLPERDVALITRAAALLGCSRTEFIRDVAVRAAEEVLSEQSTLRLSPDRFAAFTAALSAQPQKVAEAIRQAPTSAAFRQKEGS